MGNAADHRNPSLSEAKTNCGVRAGAVAATACAGGSDTGGGPGDATNVASLEIFYEAYARLSLGTAAAMSWVLALFLIGFTLFQIRYMGRLEFRSAGAGA